MELSAQDRRTIVHIEQEAAHGQTAEALKDLDGWTHSVGIGLDQQKLAASELERSGVLPVLGIEKLKEEVHSSGEPVSKERISDLVSKSKDSPIDEAILKTAQDNMLDGSYPNSRHYTKNWDVPDENENTLGQLQFRIEQGRPAEDVARALAAPDANGKTLLDKLGDPKEPDHRLTRESIEAALQNNDELTADQRDVARQLAANISHVDVKRMAEVTSVSPYITQESLDRFLKFHPQAPADLPTDQPTDAPPLISAKPIMRL
jgi:hypothetical protein